MEPARSLSLRLSPRALLFAVLTALAPGCGEPQELGEAAAVSSYLGVFGWTLEDWNTLAGEDVADGGQTEDGYQVYEKADGEIYVGFAPDGHTTAIEVVLSGTVTLAEAEHYALGLLPSDASSVALFEDVLASDESERLTAEVYQSTALYLAFGESSRVVVTYSGPDSSQVHRINLSLGEGDWQMPWRGFSAGLGMFDVTRKAMDETFPHLGRTGQGYEIYDLEEEFGSGYTGYFAFDSSGETFFAELDGGEENALALEELQPFAVVNLPNDSVPVDQISTVRIANPTRRMRIELYESRKASSAKGTSELILVTYSGPDPETLQRVSLSLGWR